MDDEPRRQPTHWVWVTAAVMVPVLYLLGSGPAVYVYDKLDGGPVVVVIECVYGPVNWLGNYIPYFDDWMIWYLNFFK